MVLLTRKKQLSAVVQSGTGVPSGLDDAANADTLILDLEGTLDFERIDRNLIQDTITTSKDLTGQKVVELTFGVEMKGTRDGLHASGAPDWGRFVRACGFDEVEVQGITIGAITATGSGGSTTFRHRELVTQTGSGATARVIKDTHNGSTTLHIVKSTITGTPDGSGAWVGEDSGASATPSAAPADIGYGWQPVTDPTKTITLSATATPVALAAGDLIEGTVSGAIGVVHVAVPSGTTDAVIEYRPVRGAFANAEQLRRLAPTATADIGTTAADVAETFKAWPPLAMRKRLDGKSITVSGARGNMVVNLEVNRQARLEFSFRGVLVDLLDRPLISGVQYDVSNPPLWETAAIGFANNETAADRDLADEITPCLNTLSFDMGVQLADRKCAGATSGLLEIRGSDRQGTASLDPEDTLEADAGWLTAVRDGSVYRLSTTVGSQDGDRFLLAAPGLQFTGAAGGDRDQIATLDMTARLTGGDLFDLDTGAQTNSSIGGDNELIILYFTA